MNEIPKPENLRKNGGLWLELGSNQVHLSIQDGYDPSKKKAHLAYEVSDLVALSKRQAEHGISTQENDPIEGYRRLNARDPFGNRMEFMQAV